MKKPWKWKFFSIEEAIEDAERNMWKLDKTKAPQKIGIPSGFPRKTQVCRQNC